MARKQCPEQSPSRSLLQVAGVEYTKDGKTLTEHGVVIIASGGFAADFTQDSLLTQVEQEWRSVRRMGCEWNAELQIA